MTKIIEVECEHVGRNGLRALMFAAKAGIDTKKPFKVVYAKHAHNHSADKFVFTQTTNN